MSALYTIECSAQKPTLPEAATLLKLPLHALDAGFGVVLIDPAKHLYAVRILDDHGNSRAPGRPGVSGPFSDPQIEGFGPPRR
jgi:hypothetical protein